MIGSLFLLDWAARGAALALVAEIAIRVLRVKDVSTRLAISVAVLLATLSLPLCTLLAPDVVRPVNQISQDPTVNQPSPIWSTARIALNEPPAKAKLPLAAIYAIIAALLLTRTAFGLYLTSRLTSRARPIVISGVYESDEITVPVTVGLLRPIILLPSTWLDWSAATLDAVLEHEQSHIRRHDTRIQFLSSLHRAILWFSPVSWWLNARLAGLAEDASDDRALAVADPVSYAETLLHFVQQAPRRVLWSGVSMARTLKAERRIDRILSGHLPSPGLRPAVLAAIVLTALPLTYLMAASRDDMPPSPPVPAIAPMPPQAPPTVAPRAPREPLPVLARPSPVPPLPPAAPIEPFADVAEGVGPAVDDGRAIGGVVAGVRGGVSGGIGVGRARRDASPFDYTIRSIEREIESLNRMIESLREQQALLDRSVDDLPPPAVRRLEQLRQDVEQLNRQTRAPKAP